MALRASTVSRYLAAQGFDRSVYHRSSRVRGWGNSSEGFSVETLMRPPWFREVEAVRVSYTSGTYITSRHDSEKEAAKLNEIAEALERRFDVVERNGRELIVREATQALTGAEGGVRLEWVERGPDCFTADSDACVYVVNLNRDSPALTWFLSVHERPDWIGQSADHPEGALVSTDAEAAQAEAEQRIRAWARDLTAALEGRGSE